MVSPRLFTMGLVTSPFIAQALSRSPREAFRRCTTRASSLLSATMLAGSCRTSRPGCALVNWHIELGVEPICHPPDDGAVRGDGYENVALGRGPGVSLGEWVARPDMESDEPLLAGIQARTARGQVVADPPRPLRQNRRQDHRNGDRCGAAAGITDP